MPSPNITLRTCTSTLSVQQSRTRTMQVPMSVPWPKFVKPLGRIGPNSRGFQAWKRTPTCGIFPCLQKMSTSLHSMESAQHAVTHCNAPWIINKLTINTIRHALGTEPAQVEKFLRTKVKFYDDALILELLAYICRSNPLKLLENGFPFHRNYWGFLDLRPLVAEIQQFTIQELVEETLYNKTFKSKVLRIGNNRQTYRRYSYRLG